MTPALPKGKSLQDIFADFIRYLFDSTEAFIQEHEPMGDILWRNFEQNIDLILSHPNGWEGHEQEFLRKSVVQASVFTEKEALSRVSFVTEGEATFNFCVSNTKSGELLEVSSFRSTLRMRSDRSFKAWTQGPGRRCRRWNYQRQFLHREFYVAAEGGRDPRTKM